MWWLKDKTAREKRSGGKMEKMELGLYNGVCGWPWGVAFVNTRLFGKKKCKESEGIIE